MKSVFKVLAVGVFELLILISIFFVMGYGITVIISPSMAPELVTNALVITHKTPINEITKGDIIQYKSPEYGQVMHRVQYINMSEGKVIALATKGDNNELYDMYVATQTSYRAEVVCYSNEVAPLITLIFGSFITINYVRVVTGVIVIGLLVVLVLGTVTRFIDKVIKKIMKGAKSHDNNK